MIRFAASAHTCEEVIEYVSEKGLVYEIIPVGLTSIVQILKAAIKKMFLQWKISQRVESTKMITHWIEEAVSTVNETHSCDRKIEYMFHKLGQDPRKVYASLLLNQSSMLGPTKSTELTQPVVGMRIIRGALVVVVTSGQTEVVEAAVPRSAGVDISAARELAEVRGDVEIANLLSRRIAPSVQRLLPNKRLRLSYATSNPSKRIW
ncbi:hypothetical protein ON010_g2251 [Phytophthora cinnamomi]|nr:hypothetical protein ON010_g2251 [Phytophthora cinnamomi]